MTLPKRDLVATVVVAVGALVYVLWVAGAALPALHSARVSGAVVLALGFIASASAVVPTFTALLHGNKAYLAVTSLLGLVAFVGGLLTLISASAVGFGLMVGATVVLWAISTVHHVRSARVAAEAHCCPNCGRPVRQLHCDVCGYELIAQTRERVLRAR